MLPSTVAIQVGSDDTEQNRQRLQKKATMKSYLSALRACSLAKTGGICCSHLSVYKEQLVGVVVDEAHCVKKW